MMALVTRCTRRVAATWVPPAGALGSKLLGSVADLARRRLGSRLPRSPPRSKCMRSRCPVPPFLARIEGAAPTELRRELRIVLLGVGLHTLRELGVKAGAILPRD